MTDVREAVMVGRTSDGRTVRRPLSPHLQVYRWQLTMALSIVHRATGIGLGVGTLLLVWWLVAAAWSDAAYAGVAAFSGSWFGYLCLFGWTASLWYHFCNGMRHLGWDFGYGYEIGEMRGTGIAVLAATVVLTVLTWVIWFVVL
jgi:succinate dehydrogenase / fumarate reductase, cytochrome b subunit